MIKYLLAFTLTLISLISAAAENIDEYLTSASIEAALIKADTELSTFQLDDEYYTTLYNHYVSNPNEILTKNFVKYYLVGTCDLHELLVMAHVLETDELDYHDHNRAFFKSFLALFTKNQTNK